MSERVELMRARQQLGISREEMGRLVGVNRHQVFQIEVGNRQPSLVTASRWIAALGPDASMDLFGSETVDTWRRYRSLMDKVLPDEHRAV